MAVCYWIRVIFVELNHIFDGFRITHRRTRPTKLSSNDCKCLDGDCSKSVFPETLLKTNDVEFASNTSVLLWSVIKIITWNSIIIFHLLCRSLSNEKEDSDQVVSNLDIREFCTNLLINSSIAKTCGPYFDRDIMHAIDICSHSKHTNNGNE